MAKIDKTKEPIKEFEAMNPQDALTDFWKYFGAKSLRIKKLHPKAVTPKYAKPGDAGLDLVCVDSYEKDGLWVCHLGLAFEIPKGYFGAIYPRSSIKNYDLRLSNCVGVVDSQFRGEVMAYFDFTSDPRTARVYRNGDKCCQMIIQKCEKVFPIEVEELSETERGTGGFGSTGK